MLRTLENLPPIYYDADLAKYWTQNPAGRWICSNEHQIEQLLRSHKVSPKVVGTFTSPLDEQLLRIRNECDVHYAAPLAGYKSGLVEMNGQRVLVTASPNLVMPAQGDWSVLEKFITGLLADDDHDQVTYFYGWLKVAIEALHAGSVRPGQVFVISGPKDCGKSLLQQIITMLLGGRVAHPYYFMCGKTYFNGELFAAEHLMIADQHAETKLAARRQFGEQTKAFTVNEDQWCHAKMRPGLTLKPFWRISMSLNDEPECVIQLPPMEDGVTDKFILTKANKFQMPMPTGTLDQRKAFWDKLVESLPGFVHYLLNWQIPEKDKQGLPLASERFGITHFHHPVIIHQLDSLAPESKLLKIIDSTLFCNKLSEWTGTAEDLEQALSHVGNARRLFTFDTACGVYLGRLAEKYPKRVTRSKGEKKEWVIKRVEETK